MTPPLVSVVINNHNYGRYLPEAIESALNQTYPHLEVIVVDDGSTDGSQEIVRAYEAQGRVRGILKARGGQASAMNAGYAASRGSWVLFLDSDDVLLPQALERAIAQVAPGTMRVSWRMEVVDENLRPKGETLPPDWMPMPSGDLSAHLLRWGYAPSPPTSGNLFSRSFLEGAMPIPEEVWPLYADTYLLFLSTLRGKVVSLEERLTLYRRHGQNNSSRLEAEKMRERLDKALEREKLLREEAARLGKRGAFRDPYEAKWILYGLTLFPEERRFGPRAVYGLKGALWALSFPFTPGTWPRLRLALWFLLAGLLPLPLARPLARYGLSPEERPYLLKLLARPRFHP